MRHPAPSRCDDSTVTIIIPDPYARTVFHGKPGDWATVQALKVAESRLGYELTIYQFIGHASASGDTHSDGRAVDLAPFDWQRKVRVLRNLGFAAWYRPERKGVWVAHIHAILIFPDRANRKGISPAGYAQIGDYDHGGPGGVPGDGLAGTNRDSNPYRPKPRARWSEDEYRESFTVPAQRPVVTPVSKARDRIVEAHRDLGFAITQLQKTKRKAPKASIPALRTARGALRATLKALPKK